ncbi:MAG TPA: hypothetical protein P5123_12695, partial [Spirochaetota bacterium]|nr:hypothetical protein [Spirochaetota bacterium]
MSFSGFANNHLFSFLFKHEEKEFIDCFEPILLKKGAKLTIEPSNIFYYYIESGSVSVSFENGNQTLVMHSGDGFGRLPFAVTSDRYSINVLEESLVFRIDDERMLLYLLSDLKKIRGYLGAVVNSGIEIINDELVSGLSDTAVIGVVGEVKSGKTLFSALIAKNLSEKGRVLLIDASRSHSGLSALLGCNSGVPVVIKEQNKEFDYQKYLVEVNSNLSLINFSDGEKTDNSNNLLAALIVNTSFEFDYIVIDGCPASISEYVLANCDCIFNMCRNGNDKRSAGIWLDRFICEGQRIVHVANRLFLDNSDGYSVNLDHITDISRSGFEEATKNIRVDDAVKFIDKKNINFF